MSKPNIEKIAEDIIKQILDAGLGESTWRDQHPFAYGDLLAYRKDLQGSAIQVLEEWERYCD